jgi:CRP-like cAMP-binding protein
MLPQKMNIIISEILKLGRMVKVPSGQKVFAQGDPARLFFYLCSGCVVTCVT